MPDLRPALAPAFAAFGSPATVTPRGGAPIATLGIWLPPGRQVGVFGDAIRVGADVVLDRRPRMAVRRDQVPVLPPGSTIEAPPQGGGALHVWTVVSVDPTDAEVLVAVMG